MGVHLPNLCYCTVAVSGVVFCGGVTILDTVTGLFFNLLVCDRSSDVYCCVLMFVPLGPWLSDKGRKPKNLNVVMRQWRISHHGCLRSRPVVGGGGACCYAQHAAQPPQRSSPLPPLLHTAMSRRCFSNASWELRGWRCSSASKTAPAHPRPRWVTRPRAQGRAGPALAGAGVR